MGAGQGLITCQCIAPVTGPNFHRVLVLYYFEKLSTLEVLDVYLFETQKHKGLFTHTVSIVGVSRRYTDHHQGRGHSIRPTAALINIHEHLIQCLISASHHQLTNDHGPACMCHCIFFGINPRVSKYHALCHHRATSIKFLSLCQWNGLFHRGNWFCTYSARQRARFHWHIDKT